MHSEETYEGSFPVEGGSFLKAGNVSSNIKNILKNLGIRNDTVRRVAIVTYESEINIVSYARKGVIHLTVNPRFVQIDAIDEGQGIVDVEQAMQEGFSTAPPSVREMGFGAGMGLGNMKKYSDEFDLSSEVDVGTRVRMKIYNGEIKK
jgi:anti-sigma regulatory factor (Ser/Thr protein kinase)